MSHPHIHLHAVIEASAIAQQRIARSVALANSKSKGVLTHTFSPVPVNTLGVAFRSCRHKVEFNHANHVHQVTRWKSVQLSLPLEGSARTTTTTPDVVDSGTGARKLTGEECSGHFIDRRV